MTTSEPLLDTACRPDDARLVRSIVGGLLSLLHNSRRANVGEHGLEDSVVSSFGTSEVRQLQPDNEESLEGKVPGNVVQNHAKHDALDKGEETENDPICQPLNIILGRRGLDSLEGEISRKCPSNEGGDGGGERVEKVE